MDKYQKISDYGNVNHFDNICGCFNNLCSLSMGCLFPQCLFGRIYEISGFGECFTGCCKIFSIQFIINLIFSGIIINKELTTLYSSKQFNEQISECKDNLMCKDYYYNYTNIYDNNCVIKNTSTCNCLIDPLLTKCNYEKSLSNNLLNLLEYISIISFINFIMLLTLNGCFYGHYRTKISRRYNILHNSRWDFIIHFLPCVHQIALCQEYNTVSRLELEPVYAVNVN